MRKRYRPSLPAVVIDRRVSVDLAGKWRDCTDTLPRGCEVLGTISHGREISALVRLEGSGNLAKVSRGAVGMVNQGQTQRLIDAASKPTAAPVMVSADEWES